ncbi:MAG: ATP-binding protein [Pseudomonadota bacterium]
MSTAGPASGSARFASLAIDAPPGGLESIMRTFWEPLLVLDEHYRILAANPAFYRLFKVGPAEVRDAVLFELGDAQWGTLELRSALRKLLKGQRHFQNCRIEHTFPGIGHKAFQLNGQLVIDTRNGKRRLLLAFNDVTVVEATVVLLREAREQNERRVANELHDLSSGDLAALGMELAHMTQVVSTASADVTQYLHAAQKRVQSLAASTHELSRRIHPSVLADLGLATAISGACEDFEHHHKVAVSFRASGPLKRLPDAVALCALRVVHEALRNVARHANARRVSVRITLAARKLRLSVQDNGAGFKAADTRANGRLGLRGISDRVAAVGGTLSVRSRPGQGTLIRVVVPIVPLAAPVSRAQPPGTERRTRPRG